MKKTMIFLLTGLLFLSSFSIAYANQDGSTYIKNQFEAIDMSELETFIQEIDKDISKNVPKFSLSDTLKNLYKGDLKIDLQDMFNSIGKYFFSEIYVNLKLMSTLIILAVIFAIFENIQASFIDSTLSKVTFWVCGLAILTIAIGSFTMTVDIARDTVDKMTTFFNSLLPVILTLIVSTGRVTSAAVLSPLTIGSTSFFSNLINNIVIPLAYISTILFILDHLSEDFKISSLAKLVKDTCMAIIGISLTIYIGILSLQGLASGVTDGIALETAKFATGAFIPVIGKFFSDAITVVTGTSLLIKNAVSVIGMLAVAAICIFPMLKILAIVIIYRLTAALVQPFGAKKVVEIMNTIANCLLLIFAAVAASCLMLFIAISILIKIGMPI